MKRPDYQPQLHRFEDTVLDPKIKRMGFWLIVVMGLLIGCLIFWLTRV